MTITKQDNKQDIKIGKLEVKVDNLDNKFDVFIDNDFKHLRALVIWLIGISITGILIPIFLKLYL